MKTSVDILTNPCDKVFDETNKHWASHAEHNELFVRAQLNWAQDMLNARGYLFLNEVYESLGFEPTRFGATHGWTTERMKFKAITYPEIGKIKIEFYVQGDILSALPEF